MAYTHTSLGHEATVVTNMGAFFAFYEATDGANWNHAGGNCSWDGENVPCNHGWPGSAEEASDPDNDPCLGKSGNVAGHWSGVYCCYTGGSLSRR